MLAVLLALVGSLGDEIGISLGKNQVERARQTVYALGSLQLWWGTVFFLLIALVRPDSFVFSFASLPTIIPRLILEVVQAHVMILALTSADRSTYGFIRTLTIPLLLAVDIWLGYELGSRPVWGVVIIMAALLIIFGSQRIGKAGLGYVLFSAVNAAITISLYKYNITHFNSVVAEQLVIHVVVLGYFMARGCLLSGQSLRALFRGWVPWAQSVLPGLAGLAVSFAYQFAPASLVLTAYRSGAVLWSTLTGTFYFRERHLLPKLALALWLMAGLTLLALP